jgi:hypothetical protein
LPLSGFNTTSDISWVTVDFNLSKNDYEEAGFPRALTHEDSIILTSAKSQIRQYMPTMAEVKSVPIKILEKFLSKLLEGLNLPSDPIGWPNFCRKLPFGRRQLPLACPPPPPSPPRSKFGQAMGSEGNSQFS